MPALNISTRPLDEHIPFDVGKMVELVFSRPGTPKYPVEVVQKIGERVNYWADIFQISPRFVMAQILHETNFFRFGNDVQWWQFNFAGLGAEGGIIGHTLTDWKANDPDAGWRDKPAEWRDFNPAWADINVDQSIDNAVLAVIVHHMYYLRGIPSDWATPLRKYASMDPRGQAVVKAGLAGSVTDIGSYGGKWAVGKDYGKSIVNVARLLVEKETQRMLKLAISAGHHNKSGGNQRETALTGPLTHRYIEIGRQLGHDVRSMTPNDGLGMFDGDLSQCAAQVVKWKNEGWPADVFLEVHFEGIEQGKDIGLGAFVIYPDWGNDVDTDVRDRFGPDWANVFTTMTGLGKRSGNALMSEQKTGVGLQGSRLGVFGATANAASTTTRMIIEHGNHTAPHDNAIIQKADFNEHAVRAFYISLHRLFNLPAPVFGGPTPGPTPPTPGTPIYGQAFQSNGFWVIEEMAWKIEQIGSHWFSVLGSPNSGMFVATVDKTPRKVQVFEKGALGIYNPGTPDGAPYGDPFHVRNLLPWERASVIEQGIALHMLPPDYQKPKE